MDPVMFVIGIILAALLLAAGVAVFVTGKKSVYGAAAVCLSIVIIAALFVFGGKGFKDGSDGTPDGKTTDSDVILVTDAPGAENSDLPTGTASADETVAPTETPVITAVPTETPTPEPAQAPTEAPTYEPVPSSPNGSVIYLTFDDGPSVGVTELILDTLKKYDVKATFFIIDFEDEEIPLLKRMVDEGHTIGIHGYSHVYADIYASEEAFMENIYKLSDKLEEKVGYKADIIRFPGGSSNLTSKKYCPGIMTALTKRVVAEGYQYFDWNVSPEDAMSKLSAETIANAVLNDLRSARKQNVVLMHDSGSQMTTAQAVEKIIVEAMSRGYGFDSLSKETPPCQHSVQN